MASAPKTPLSVKRSGKKNKDKVATRQSDLRSKQFPKGGSPSGDARPVDWATRKRKPKNPKAPKAR